MSILRTQLRSTASRSFIETGARAGTATGSSRAPIASTSSLLSRAARGRQAYSQLAAFKVPNIENEPMRSYAPGSADRLALQAAVKRMESSAPFEVPCIIDGQEVRSGNLVDQPMPHNHKNVLARYHSATPEMVSKAIESSLKAKQAWEEMPWADRAAIFLKAADLIAGKYRYEIMAATMLGQGKNAWQAEIDSTTESCDFLRFGTKFAEQLYSVQPGANSPGVWNRTEYRPLEGFVLAVSPFNFTAIGVNLTCIPALVGNVILWKPSPMATYSNYLTHKILLEAGLPPSVIQFVPGNPPEVVSQAMSHPDFAGLSFTGSTQVFKELWAKAGNNLNVYKGYPRLVGETGGKNFHLYHKSADIESGVIQAVRAAFEYSGQKCSALSRVYIPRSLWEGGFREQLIEKANNLAIGPCTEWSNFTGPVINQASFDKITSIIEEAKQAGGEVIAGGSGDASKGFFVKPTVIVTKDPKSVSMTKEIFGPVMTVYVYEDADFEKTCDLIDTTTEYALTGSIFATDREPLRLAAHKLRNAAGNFYINDKCTGAVVGQQPFGGARGSGTNDKAGSINVLYRFVSARSIKENFVNPTDHLYPSNLLEPEAQGRSGH